MKEFVLEEISLKSGIEKRGRKISFQPGVNIVLGENDTGKSSLLKSIYWTFGADSAMIHDRWKEIEVSSAVQFVLKDKRYIIYRKGKLIGLFNEDRTIIKSFSSIIKDLSPFFGKLFDFGFMAVNREGLEVTAPPAYYFLPFYIDQDISWTVNWNAFGGLTYLPNFRTDLVDYHVGIKNNQYYELNNKKRILSLQIKETEDRLKFFETTLEKFKNEYPELNYDLDIESFKIEIQNLLKNINSLQGVEDKLKFDLSELYVDKQNIETQITIVERAKKEIDKDYNFVFNEAEDIIKCPTCGSSHKNSFGERFEIARDQSRCEDLINELNYELLEVGIKINKCKEKYTNKNREIQGINEILSKKKDILSLNDIIKNEGHKQMKEILSENLTNTEEALQKFRSEIKLITKELKKILEIKKIIEIKSLYMQSMKDYLNKLDVGTLSEESYKKLSCNINETGSDLPRSLLAYYFSILKVMKKYSSSVFAPIIIDSPNQQAQDKTRLEKIIDFIKNEKMEDTQLILGLEDLCGVKFEANLISLNNRNSLLLDNEYDLVNSQMSELDSKSLLYLQNV